MLAIIARAAPRLINAAKKAFSAGPKKVSQAFTSATKSGADDVAKATTQATAKTATTSAATSAATTVVKEVPQKGALTMKKMLAYQAGATAMLASAGLGLAVAENQSDGAFSQSVIGGLQKIVGKENALKLAELGLKTGVALSAEETDAKVSVLMNSLRATEQFEEGELETEEAQRTAKLFVYAAHGDIIGVGNTAAKMDLQFDDVVGAYSDALEENENASQAVVFKATTKNLQARIEERKQEIRNQAENTATTIAATAATTASVGSASAVFETVSGEVKATLSSLSDAGISTAFNTAAENSGFLGGLVMNVVASFLDVFMEKEDAQRIALGLIGAEAAQEAINHAATEGLTRSATGSSLAPRPAEQLDLDPTLAPN